MKMDLDDLINLIRVGIYTHPNDENMEYHIVIIDVIDSTVTLEEVDTNERVTYPLNSFCEDFNFERNTSEPFF